VKDCESLHRNEEERKKREVGKTRRKKEGRETKKEETARGVNGADNRGEQREFLSFILSLL